MSILFTQTANCSVNNAINFNLPETLPRAILKHTDRSYLCQKTDTGYSLKPTFHNTTYRNSFIPEIDVVVSSDKEHTILQMHGRPVKFVRIFMAIWFIVFLMMELCFLLSLLLLKPIAFSLYLSRSVCVYSAICFVNLPRKQPSIQLLKLSDRNTPEQLHRYITFSH